MHTWQEPRLLDSFKGRMRLEGHLTTRTGLHIGAGATGDPLGTDLTVVRNAAGEPFIPGSSLKGVIRSAAEALFRSGDPRPELAKEKQLDACNPLSNPCVKHEELKTKREHLEKQFPDPKDKGKVDPLLAQFAWEKSCSICQLFGSLALAGRVRIPDLPLACSVAPLEIRNGVAIDRDKELAVSGALYDFEAIPPGTDFALTVIVDNPIPAEIGLLLYLFDELNEGHLALGGKSSRGLGLVQVSWEKVFETKAVGNPFRDKLAQKNLLAPEEETAPETEPEAEIPLPLPTTGNAEDWALLARILTEQGSVDKNALATAASAKDLTKHELSERLGLGIDSARRAWDVTFERLAESGFLEQKEGRYVLATREDKAAEVAEELSPKDQALNEIHQTYLDAMSKLWEEAFQCSPSN